MSASRAATRTGSWPRTGPGTRARPRRSRCSSTSPRRSSRSPRRRRTPLSPGPSTCAGRPGAPTTSPSTGCSWARARRRPRGTLLRRSAVPVAAGTLGEWLALADGPYVLALEAEDTNGNEARVTRRVVVDTLPPEPPVLDRRGQGAASRRLARPVLAAEPVGRRHRHPRLPERPPRELRRRSSSATARASSSPGRPTRTRRSRTASTATTSSPWTGRGTSRSPRTRRCQSLDNRAPRAVIVHPPDGTRFGYPVRVVAETPDLDVASVRFERRASGAADWVGFGEVRSAPPWETTLDPDAARRGGAGRRRARAAGGGDGRDRATPIPTRPAITVVYGDTTPPSAPTGLVARVDGADVTLTWTPVDAPDFASYSVYRDGERIAEGLTEPRHVDPGLAPEHLRVRRDRGRRRRERERPERARARRSSTR